LFSLCRATRAAHGEARIRTAGAIITKGLARWRAFLPLFTSHGNVEERIGVERTASRHSRYLYSVCAYAREKERNWKLARDSMPCTKSQLESHPLSASFIVYYVRYTDNSNFLISAIRIIMSFRLFSLPLSSDNIKIRFVSHVKRTTLKISIKIIFPLNFSIN
jgi:hypothetical protein